MRRLVMAAAVLGLFLATTGCTYVVSAQGGNTSKTNGAWFTEITGLGRFLPFSTRVYYCPPMGTGGASTCMEAEMIEGAQPAAPAAGGAAEPAPEPAPEGSEGMEGEGMEGGEGAEGGE